MSELAGHPVEMGPEDVSLGRRVLNAIAKALSMEQPVAEQTELAPAAVWRGNHLYDADGNILAVRDSSGNVY